MHATTSDDRIRVFVYGTLRRGERNHGYLEDAVLLGPHVTPARYIMYDTGPFPAAVDGGKQALTGEVYTVDRRGFRQLDRLEDYPRHYTRRRIPTPYGTAWIYLWVAAIDPRWRRLAGDWCRCARRWRWLLSRLCSTARPAVPRWWAAGRVRARARGVLGGLQGCPGQDHRQDAARSGVRLCEAPGATEGGGNALREGLASLRLVRERPAFGRFVLTRTLLLSTALAALLGAPLWGRAADRSSRNVLACAGLAAAGLHLVAAGLGAAGAPVWAFAVAYFALVALLAAGGALLARTLPEVE